MSRNTDADVPKLVPEIVKVVVLKGEARSGVTEVIAGHPVTL